MSDQWLSVAGHRILLFCCHHSLMLGCMLVLLWCWKGLPSGGWWWAGWRQGNTPWQCSRCPCEWEIQCYARVYPAVQIVQHHKPECSVEKWDYCVQGQGHNEGSKCQWMFVWTIFSESQNILLPNLVWWCSIMNQSHVDIFFIVAIFKVKVPARAHIIKIWLFLLYYLNFWFLGNQTWCDDTSSEARVSYEKKGITAFRVKVTVKGQNVDVCPDDIF